MTHRRYTIRAGATASIGGTVRGASSFSILDGQPIAREGGPVHCPACGCMRPPALIADRTEEVRVVRA